ncbi:hypothetical protein IWX50DRAFT_618756 [Phyllosticta citricarpa]
MSGLEGLSIVANLFRVMGFVWDIVKELKDVNHGVGEPLEGNSQHLNSLLIRDSLRKSLNVLSIRDATKNNNIKDGDTNGEEINGGKTNGKETNGEKANDQSTKDEKFKDEEDLEDVAGVLKKFLNDSDSEMQRLVVRTSDRHQILRYARSRARATLRRNRIDELERNLKMAQEGLDTRLLAMMKKLMEENKKANRILDVLRHLRDDPFTTRFNNIESAHERTFNCIFQDDNLEFSRWLEHDGNSISWINVTPGSGKSTPSHNWAGDKRFIIASHYYLCIAGQDIQHSWAGLLRFLIFQILRQHTALKPTAFPQHWETPYDQGFQDFPNNVLKDALRKIAGETDRPKICIFIDGLDELKDDQSVRRDAGMDQAKMKLLKSTKQREKISCIVYVVRATERGVDYSVCISSQPWGRFKRAFKNDPTCLVHDHTKLDICNYAWDKIREKPELMVLDDPEFNPRVILEQIVAKAQGVFL